MWATNSRGNGRNIQHLQAVIWATNARPLGLGPVGTKKNNNVGPWVAVGNVAALEGPSFKGPMESHGLKSQGIP